MANWLSANLSRRDLNGTWEREKTKSLLDIWSFSLFGLDWSREIFVVSKQKWEKQKYTWRDDDPSNSRRDEIKTCCCRRRRTKKRRWLGCARKGSIAEKNRAGWAGALLPFPNWEITLHVQKVRRVCCISKHHDKEQKRKPPKGSHLGR